MKKIIGDERNWCVDGKRKIAVPLCGHKAKIHIGYAFDIKIEIAPYL